MNAALALLLATWLCIGSIFFMVLSAWISAAFANLDDDIQYAIREINFSGWERYE